MISSSEEYGDYGSVMGGGLAGFTGLSALNSSIRDALDWVKPGEQQEFLLPHGQHSASQEFTLYPRSGSTGVRSVKIHDTGTVGYYFAEFRTPEDGNVWGNTPGWASGVSLVYRSRDGLNYRHHWLQKIGPDAKLTMTSGDPAFTNPTGSLKVEVLDATASSARIRLTLTAVGDDYAPAPVLTVTGKKVVGMAVKANLGNPSPAFTKVLYQWRRDGALILGALGTPITGENYSFRAEDIGAQITVTVTASAPGHRAVTLVSDPITDVSWLDPQTPTVRALDPPSAGSYAEAVTGNWGEEVSFSYQWYVDGAKAGTKWNLLLTKAMVGKRVRVEVTGTRGGQSQTRSSAETVEVAPAAWAPTKPVIKGTPRYPGTLSIDEPDWGTAFVGYRYVWLKDGAYLKQYGRTLKLTPGMVGHKISIQVNGDAEGPAVWRISAPVVIDGKKLASGKVKVRGKATVGKKLTAVTGTWTAGARFKYQWYAGSKAIKKATKSTYTVTSAVKGKKLRVKITGTKTGYVPSRFTRPTPLS
ncbi:MAG: hypothetical protein HZY75_10355 [Nocardioidaceae bacterium]|nr:MAG: hypothetical protein HZY75_10355 [Nocardioidaceae bacterium]